MTDKVELHFNVEQGSSEWKKKKVGKVSGSQIVGITTATRAKTYLYEKLSELETGELPFVFVNEFMKRGNEQEPIARDIYNSHSDKDMIEVGFITNTDFAEGLLSPDGISEDMKAAIEIKCPTSKTHTQTVIEGIIPKKNLSQVIWYFCIIESLEYLDFISYDDRCLNNPYFEKRVTREELDKQISNMTEQYYKFEKELLDGIEALNL